MAGRKQAQKQDEGLHLQFKQVALNFINAITYGPQSEVACVGGRGDGKTIAALAGMIAHSKAHQAAGFPLPVQWMGATYTFQLHQDKTIPSLLEHLWKNGWRTEDGGKIARFRVGETDMVRLSLFGIPDLQSLENVRRAAHCMWFEEPAPAAVTEYTGGLSGFAWRMGCTSCRLPSHHNAKAITSNLPDEDHWLWRLFVGPNLKHLLTPPFGIKFNNRACFRIPPGHGEASTEYRAQAMDALKDRPDLLRRLFEALPRSVLLGMPVATNFRHERHVAPDKLLPRPGYPIGIGMDFGHTPTAIVGQNEEGHVKVFGAMCSKGTGVDILITNFLQPWLAKNMPWSRQGTDITFFCDPQGEVGSEASIDQSAINTIRNFFPDASVDLGPRQWPPRKDALITALERYLGLLLDPVECEDLIKALNGRAYYPTSHTDTQRSDNQKKPNHPWEDYIDALCYLLFGFGIGTSWTEGTEWQKVQVKRSALGLGHR